MIDGLTRFGALVRIVLPLSAPGLMHQSMPPWVSMMLREM